MATYNSVNRSKTATLVAATVDTVNFLTAGPVEVLNLGTTDTIWASFDGVTPTVAGDDFLPIPPQSGIDAAVGTNQVKLISAGTPQYTCSRHVG